MFRILLQVLIAFILLGLTHMGQASEIHMATVTNGMDEEINQLYIITNDDGEIEQLKMTNSNKSVGDKFFTPAGLKEGVLMKAKDDYKVVMIRSNDFEADRGGHFILDFLHDGRKDEDHEKHRKSAEFEILYDGKWKIFHKGEQVNTMHFKINKMLFGIVVGVDKVMFDFKNEEEVNEQLVAETD